MVTFHSYVSLPEGNGYVHSILYIYIYIHTVIQYIDMCETDTCSCHDIDGGHINSVKSQVDPMEILTEH